MLIALSIGGDLVAAALLCIKREEIKIYGLHFTNLISQNHKLARASGSEFVEFPLEGYRTLYYYNGKRSA